MTLLFNADRIIIAFTFWIFGFASVPLIEAQNGYQPVDSLLREAVDAISNIQHNVQQRQASRGRASNGYELIQDLGSALAEDYAQNHGRRVQKMCQFFQQGQIYRGPCPQENVQYVVQPNNARQYENYQDQEVSRPARRTEQEKYLRRLEKERRRQEKKERRRERHRERHPEHDFGDEGSKKVVEEKIIIINRPDNSGGGGGGGGNGGRGNNGNDYRVRPETIVEEEDDFEEQSNRRPQRPKTNGAQRQKNRDFSEETPCQTDDGKPGACMPAAYCYAQYSDLEDYRSNICNRQDANTPGICCPLEGDRVRNRFNNPISIPKPHKPAMKVGFISLEDINVAAKEANTFIQEYIRQERELVSHGMVQRHGSMQSLHQAFFGQFDPVQFQLTVGGFINLLTTIVIKRKFRLNNEQARDGLYKYSIENTDLEKYCIPEPSCRQSKYRTIDGSCNNFQRPLWAKSNTAFERLLPPVYDDGLHEPRTKSVNGGQLPSPRLVSQTAAKHRNIPDPKYTLMLMQWGQFIDHDLTLAASTRAANGQGLICCHPRTQRKVEHHACFPIDIPERDEFYAQHNQRCMHFVRNAPAPRSGCSLGHREQMNTLTHVIDGSMVYGATQERAKILRSFRGGRMLTSLVRNEEFLPFDRGNHSDDCAIPDQQQQQFKCFLGGDARVNEQTGLTMIHALFVREHNRIADELARLNPKWSDTNLYQEARRIVAAEIQHITYNEWLPIVVSPTVMEQFRILPKIFAFSYNYDPKINPNILNEFATAAYRFHSLVQGTFRALDNNGRPTQVIKLHEIFNNPISFYNPNAFDHFLNGFTTDPAQAWDNFFTDELTNRLFQEAGSGFGMDLVALNLQRGRDHGLPGYNKYREICGLQTARSFQDLNRFMQPGAAEVFARLYNHVDDIDLFIGGVHEDPLPDALVGPVFACIVADQFRRAKFGDRFWYENGKLPHSFKKKQMAEIRKASLASLICENTENVGRVQPLAFLRPVGWNEKINCNKIAKMNLQAWQNEKIWS